MNVKKQATKDAIEFARARMFYGEGAGIRRRLISESVDYKMRVVPGYTKAYTQALAKQDMAKHAEKAASERFRKDTAKKFARNTRAITSGRRENLTVGIGLALIVGSWAHSEGYDKKALEYSKTKYAGAKKWVKSKTQPDLKVV